jgi:hypothetical protein
MEATTTSLNLRLTNWKNNYESGSASRFLRDLAPSGDQGIELSFRILFGNRSCYRSILWLYPDN